MEVNQDNDHEDDNSADNARNEIQLSANEERSFMEDKLKEKPPLPDKWEDEKSGTELINECLTTRYMSDLKLKFYCGYLLDALENASSLDPIEYPPVLVYLHHHESIFINPFWINIFSSEEIIQHLNKNNYIIWPWDITFESNKTKFMTSWKERLPKIDITQEKCPMLIGIVRRYWKLENSSLKWTYRYEVLLDSSKPQSKDVNPKDHTLKKLIEFEQLIRNEKELVFNFKDRTQFPNEIILEIAKYSTINDAVTVFGENIYSLFGNHTKLQISNCSVSFIDQVFQKNIKPEQITSMRICRPASTSEDISKILKKLPNIISIILINPSDIELNVDYKSYCPKLICFSVYYDQVFRNIPSFRMLLPITRGIKRLEFHGPIRDFIDLDHQRSWGSETSFEYLLLDIQPNSEPSIDFHMLFWQLRDIMTSIKYIYYITDESDKNTIITDAKWTHLFNICRLLKKFIIEYNTTTKPGKNTTEKVTKTRRDIPNN